MPPRFLLGRRRRMMVFGPDGRHRGGDKDPLPDLGTGFLNLCFNFFCHCRFLGKRSRKRSNDFRRTTRFSFFNSKRGSLSDPMRSSRSRSEEEEEEEDLADPREM